ncbi:NACHT domain-containing protein [Leptolyngbya sp. NIES-2104]|uniref:NACHT domain-containing protein n=1 Tax=Leptolyngbya sp. NIES-2104 TaxID=1552121 RepID=UPI000A976986|nr:NACHT domain-containing protein [Leptolyngbya sp. NIES-2104]
MKKQLPEIRKRLSDVLLQNRTLMEVSIEEQFAPVNRSPLEAERRLQIHGEDRGTIENQLLIQTFGRDDVTGKLLILGAPGAGKTTALLGLAEQLVMGALAQPKTVIPVLFELSTWREDSQSIEQWLTEQLYELHGGNRKAKLYEQWVDRQVLLPLLDGLDELGLERQQKCTQKINEFARHYPQLVVCCRSKEFETVGMKLGNLNGAVCLQPLSDSQIQEYLRHVGSDLWNAIQTVPAMQKFMQPTEEGDPGLLRIPLFLSLAAQVYDPRSPFASEAELLGRYVDRRLSKEVRESDRREDLKKKIWAYRTVEQEPNCTETERYLSWLARQLQQRNQIEILIEYIQPDWIEAPRLLRRNRLIVRLIVGLIDILILGQDVLINALFAGLFAGLIFRLSNIDPAEFFRVSMSQDARRETSRKLRNGLIVGLVFGMVGLNGLIVGLIFRLSNIDPVESFRVSMSQDVRRETLRELKNGLIAGLTYGLILGLLGLIGGLSSGRDGIIFGLSRLIDGLIFGLIVGLIVELIGGLKQNLKIRSRPNQGIQNSLQSMLWTSALSYPAGVILAMSSPLISWASTEQAWDRLLDAAIANFPDFLLPGLLMALLIGINFGGGIACIQHVCLRFVLWQNNIAPWNMAQFLNYCTDRRILQRNGGRYRFLHRELLDYFANLRA